MHIASLEDDYAQRQLVHSILTDAGYKCSLYDSGHDLLADLARPHPYDLLLLDWELPDIDGLETLRRIRSAFGNTLPVIFVTNRSQEADLVQGLRAGADDYINKPIRPGELLARIQALLRRLNGTHEHEAAFQLAGYLIDPAAGRISLRGEYVELSPKELELALLFFRNPMRLFSRDVLSNSVWQREIPMTSRTIDTHLSNIRRKLKLRPENGVRLTTSYAMGYRLEILEGGAGYPSDATLQI